MTDEEKIKAAMELLEDVPLKKLWRVMIQWLEIQNLRDNAVTVTSAGTTRPSTWTTKRWNGRCGGPIKTTPFYYPREIK